MSGGIKTLVHSVRTTLRLNYHGWENFEHTQTAKNRTQGNSRKKGCKVQTRPVGRTSSIRGLYICAKGIDILKIWYNSTDFCCFTFLIGGISPPMPAVAMGLV